MPQDSSVPEQAYDDSNSAQAPTQESLDALFGRAYSARVFVGGVNKDEPFGTRLVSELAGGDLLVLRQALRIRLDPVPRTCPCLGDLAIELVGDSGRVAVLALHYHLKPLLRMKGWSHDAELGERHELFALLTQCGVGLQDLEKHMSEEEKESARRYEQLWLSGEGRIPIGELLMEYSKKQ